MTTILLVSDAEKIITEIEAALSSVDTTVHTIPQGKHAVAEINRLNPDLVICDMQTQNMGGFATCTAIRHEEDAGRLPLTAVLLLLDRAADVFLAQQCDADGWLFKPLDATQVDAAAKALISGEGYAQN